MHMAVIIYTALSVNRLLIFRRRESVYGIATKVRYSAMVVIEDQRLRADPCVPSVISCFHFNREIFQARLNPTIHFFHPLDARVDPS